VEPPAELVERATMTRYLRWLASERGVALDGYHALWEWSTSDLEAFWGSIWDFFGVDSPTPYARVLERREMPGASWFPGAQVNYAQHAFRARRTTRSPSSPPPSCASGARSPGVSCASRAAAIAAGLRELGVGAAIGSCPTCRTSPRRSPPSSRWRASAPCGRAARPTSGSAPSSNRFAQIEPKVLLAVDGYAYNGKRFDRTETVRAPRGGDAVLARPWSCPISDDASGPTGRIDWEDCIAAREPAALRAVPFDHPLWVLYSRHHRLPKAIVQGQGGILLEHLKKLHLHVDCQPATALLVHDHGLDDVELPRLRAAHRRDDPCSSRQPGAPDARTGCGTSRRRRR
jgi:acetoacetyl-CoA synthetase